MPSDEEDEYYANSDKETNGRQEPTGGENRFPKLVSSAGSEEKASETEGRYQEGRDSAPRPAELDLSDHFNPDQTEERSKVINDSGFIEKLFVERIPDKTAKTPEQHDKGDVFQLRANMTTGRIQTFSEVMGVQNLHLLEETKKAIEAQPLYFRPDPQ